jgi:ABC-2 type transport system ATP-binding protein
VLTTHYLEEAEALADRVAVLAKGRLVACSERGAGARSSTQLSVVTPLDAERVSGWPSSTCAATANGCT